MDIAQLLQEPTTTVAIVGATDNRHKYGSVIYRDLKSKGFTVYPVNPHRATVDGDTAYPDLGALPEDPTIVNIVVPPNQTLSVLEDAAARGLWNVWIQPGAENDAVYEYLDSQPFNALVGACIMVRSRVLS